MIPDTFTEHSFFRKFKKFLKIKHKVLEYFFKKIEMNKMRNITYSHKG